MCFRLTQVLMVINMVDKYNKISGIRKQHCKTTIVSHLQNKCDQSHMKEQDPSNGYK